MNTGLFNKTHFILYVSYHNLENRMNTALFNKTHFFLNVS